jgi:hypothetical protein
MGTAVAVALISAGMFALTSGPGYAAGPHVKAAASTPSNLLSGTQGTFDQGTGSWYGAGATVAASTQVAQAGAGSMSITTTTGGAGGAYAASGSAPASWIPAAAGQRYELNMWFEARTTARPVQAIEIFYNSAGTQVGSVFGPEQDDAVGSWSRDLPDEGVAPSGTAYIAAAAVVWGSLTAEVHYVDSAVLTTTGQQASANVAGPLHTSGTQIVQANGNPVVFRGVQWTGMAFNANPLTAPVAAQMKSWGVNFVRISLGEPYWLSTDCHFDPTYATKVDAAVQAVTSRGMVALLTLMYNDGNACSGPVTAQAMADTGSPTFWQQVAARYKSNPLVMFDLYNEPHDITDVTWLNGGTASYHEFTFQAVGMQSLYDAVRSTGASNVVITSGNNWGNRPPAVLVSGSNIILAAHVYTCPTAAPPNCTSLTPDDPSGILDNFLVDAATMPVMVTEWGWPDQNDGTYANAVISFAEAHGWGWNAYTWNNYAGGSFNLVGTQGATYEPTGSGMPVLAGLTANSGPKP